MNYTKQETIKILDNLIRCFNNVSNDDLDLKLESMILCFQFHLKSLLS